MAILSRNQRIFASELVRQTGLDPRLVGAWLISEQPAGASHPVGHSDQNWLNVGLTDSRWYGGASAWQRPRQAARHSAAWLQGQEAVPGFGRAAPGIVAFSKTAGQPLQKQISALQQSGWASSGYPNLPSVVQQNAGKYGINARGGVSPQANFSPTPNAPSQRGPSFQLQQRNVFDAEGFEQAQRQFQLGQILQNQRSPFQEFGPRTAASSPNPLLSVLPAAAPLPQEYTRAVTTLRKLAGGLKVTNPAAGSPVASPKMPRGGGYAGTEAIMRKLVDPIASRFGIEGSSYKRDRKYTSSGNISDHWVGNKTAYAGDYPTTDGAKLAHRIARRLGIRDYGTGSFTTYPVKIGGRNFRAQILWGVEGHWDHVHTGIEAV